MAQGTNNYDLFLKGSYSEQSIRNILQDHWNNGIKVTMPAASTVTAAEGGYRYCLTVQLRSKRTSVRWRMCEASQTQPPRRTRGLRCRSPW